MPDRVLTEAEVDMLEMAFREVGGLTAIDTVDLIASHRTLHQRHRLLLRRVAELEPQTGVVS